MKFSRYLLALCALALASGVGFVAGHGHLARWAGVTIPWDNTTAHSWPEKFTVAHILSSVDHSPQKIYIRKATGSAPRPLIVSLHTWSGDYTQADPLADYAVKYNWNYIHPDMRGANDKPQACLSPLVISDLNDAIGYALLDTKADASRVVIVGVSGGGYVALGAYGRLHRPIRQFMAWAPISDLKAWREQSLRRKDGYAQKIDACGADLAQRSPINDPGRADRAPLDIFAGIDDGNTGSVPITQSIRFFNHVAAEPVTAEQQLPLVDRSAPPTGALIGGRDVIFRKQSGNVALTIFQGSHEMLTDYAARRIAAVVQ
jgi:pimeloyl-ACP methyl ester carboxylesterase